MMKTKMVEKYNTTWNFNLLEKQAMNVEHKNIAWVKFNSSLIDYPPNSDSYVTDFSDFPFLPRSPGMKEQIIKSIKYNLEKQTMELLH